MLKVISLAAGGAIGTLLRYFFSGIIYRVTGGIFPWGTLFVNLSGSFIIGLLWGFFDMESLSSNIRNFLFIGILGGFTTFSTFAFESFGLLRDGEVKLAISNLLVSNLFGVALVFIGYLVSRHIINLIR